jgi:hypothetical protein
MRKKHRSFVIVVHDDGAIGHLIPQQYSHEAGHFEE